MKKILMLLAFAGVASVASAQQTVTVTEYDVIQVQDKHQVITNPFCPGISRLYNSSFSLW